MVRAEDLKNIFPGQIVSLSDEQTLEEAMKNGNVLGSVDFRVTTRTWFGVVGDICEYILYDIAEPNQVNSTDIFLLVCVVPTDGGGEEIDVAVVFPADGFEPGNKEDLVNNEYTWLFEEPEDTSNWVPKELEFADNIYEENQGKKLTYRRKGQTLYGESSEGKLFGTTEYFCEDSNNPELWLLEHGALDEDEGGFVQLFQGTKIGMHEIKVIGVNN